MTLSLALLALTVTVFLSAVFSGSETGFYRLSPLRVDLRASEGSRSFALIRRLLSNDGLLLVTILVGNNLMIELATRIAEVRLAHVGVVPEQALEVVVTLVVTPVLFFFGELLPKDLFRRRPHALVSRAVWLIAAAKLLFLPLSLLLDLLARGFARLLGLGREELARALGREKVVELVEESARGGAVGDQQHDLVRNALRMHTTDVRQVMVPWRKVRSISLEDGPAEQRSIVLACNFTRLPVVGAGGAVESYAHQIDVLRSPDKPVASCRHPLLALAPDLSVERALARLRLAGQRVALVGTPGAPLGIVTLKDLVEEISGELWGW
jgi:CBS domain containing-hemolysin-like protein